MIGNGISGTLPSRNVSRWPNSNKAAIGHRICAQDMINKRVDCSFRDFTEVPQDLYPDVHELNLRNNDLITLRNVSFQFYIYLEKIDLHRANIHYIERDTFRPLKNLKYLTLSWNRALHFSKDVVQWSSELALLDLSDCGLTFIDFRVLNFLPKLEEIDLSINHITNISGESQNTDLITNLVSTIVTKHTQEKFAKAKFLPKISLNYNPIKIVDPATIAVLAGKMLALEGHPLSREAIRNLSIGIANGGIESLSMESSGIENITSDMFEPLRNTSLAYLGLSEKPAYPVSICLC